MPYLNEEEKKRFSLVARAKSVAHALRGVYIFLATTHAAWIQIPIALGIVILGFVVGVNRMEWIAIVLSIGLVLITEAQNTAIEIDIDLTSPEFHPYARDTKDVAAGAVIIAAFFSAIVLIIVFYPYILEALS